MPNRLINELSPYLLQHAHNPVDWYPWGDEPFERAKRENKPVLVSIGYAACHWCHVMERESFEHHDVAAYMNEHFINIKVDREEHPDVDHMYMDAVQALTGSGGWPLNAFVTPDRIPFYGGTYFPPRAAYGRISWPELLQRMNAIWHEQQDEVGTQSSQMLEYLKTASANAVTNTGEKWDTDTCKMIADSLMKQADTVNGGFGPAPKFPGTMSISYLLEYYHYTGDENCLSHALKSLDAMIMGGIYDQIGGGFARYATDNKWLVPHFEKMLYDNALLISTLCDAYSITRNERYKKVIEETINFVERELKSPTGLYYSAIDADSEGVEGKYYTWTWNDWQNVIGDDSIAERYFGITEAGNWDGTNILHVAVPMAQIIEETGKKEQEIIQHIEGIKLKLLNAAKTRVRPQTDDKSLLSWNALMSTALSKASAVLQQPTYAALAQQHMQLIFENFVKKNDLQHVWKQGTARISANLDDIAYLVQALLQLATATGVNDWILKADEIMQNALQYFSHEEGYFFYYSSSEQHHIPVRKVDVYDGATPSANAVMAHNLLLLGLLMEEVNYTERAYAMLYRMSGSVKRYGSSFGCWAIQLQRYSRGIKSVVCTGEQASILAQNSIPEAYILTSKKEISEIPILKHKILWQKEMIFICTQDACMPPMPYPADVLRYLNSKNK